MVYLNFNSKVVRLKVVPLTAVPPFKNLFQFQSGAVKSEASFRDHVKFFLFQFQSGAVKS